MSETPAIAPKPDRIPVETRMANTNEAVKAMLAAEAAARAEKTKQLRALRLAQAV